MSASVRVAVVGSRTYPRLALVDRYVDSLEPGDTVVSGNAPGVDIRAETRARRRGDLHVVSLPARWRRPDGSRDYGAGKRRNTDIVAAADEVVAFISQGGTAGTADTMAKTLRAGKPLTVVDHRGLIVPHAAVLEIVRRLAPHITV